MHAGAGAEPGARNRTRSRAAGKGAELICLPELFQTQYFCQREDVALFDLAEPIPGPTTKRLGDVARELKVTIVASLFERRAPGLYHNTAAIIDTDGKLAGIYRKMHIPDDPLYYEKYYFTPGDLGFKAFETDFGKVGTLVCWDQWYPEGARLTALQGANVLFYPTAIGWHPEEKAKYGEAQYDAWRTIQRAHAIANGVYVAVPNRVGFETGNIRGNEVQGKGLEFWGGSFIADPFGRVIAEGLARQGRNSGRRGRPTLHRRGAPQLALPARPPHRRLRADHAEVHGKVDAHVKEVQDRSLATAAALGYRMPAEWEPHEATWIAWPHNRTDWPGKFEAIP